MKSYLRILAFAKPYLGNAILNAIFNTLMTIFSLVSIGVIIPILDMIFATVNPVVKKLPEFSWELDVIKEFVNQKIANEIVAVGPAQALLYVCAFAATCIFLKNLFNYLALFVIAPLRNGVIHDLRIAVYAKCLNLPISYFTDKRKGDLLTRMSSDVGEIEWTILTSLEMMVREPLNIILIITVLVNMSPTLTLFIFLVFPIAGLTISIIGRSLKRSSGQAQNQLGRIMSILEESLGGVRIIKAFRAEGMLTKKFTHESLVFTRLKNKVLRKKDASSPISETLGVMVILLVIWYGGQRVFSGEMSGGSLIGYIMFFYMLIPSFKSLTNAINNIQKGNASSERILEILDAPNLIIEKENPVTLADFKDKMEFKDVSFSYSQNGGDVLKKINFTLEKGKSIALVGASGSGKTTISNLVPRFYDIKSGSITIDGIDLRDLSFDSLRGIMGMVSQESILFNDTAKANIALSKPNATDEEIIKAAKIANAHEFLSEMDGGYDANIGEGGGKLSGGQKQRMSIARAVLNDPPFLVLDEATSSLDTESEKLVQEALNHLMENRTSLIIAHRLSTIQHADEILVMDKGEIVERGTHKDLLAKEGTYYKLVKMQSFA